MCFTTFPNTDKRPAENMIQSRDNKEIIERQQIYVICEQIHAFNHCQSSDFLSLNLMHFINKGD